MAVSDAPVRHEDHYIHTDRSDSSNSGFWAVIIILAIVLALLLFGTELFGWGRTNNNSGTNIEGTVNTPNGTYQGSGTVDTQ